MTGRGRRRRRRRRARATSPSTTNNKRQRHGLVYRVGSKRKDEDRAVAGEHVTCGGERASPISRFLTATAARTPPTGRKLLYMTKSVGEGTRHDKSDGCSVRRFAEGVLELDEDGSAHVDAGTTATILCIGRSTATLGWVDDSPLSWWT